ncbi:MAG: type II secretion system protein GspD [SAR86 cluster bacterium]|jgi:general secretion pathway protein D|uniref:Type II secretion system protein GspD n=1 Tax=SAR86 cluster bacterium TaxID=2030880 RepID=A0A520N0M5_9GAMM|nr:MAG: type II secretion system protein GspD [SAR86 cluster bacterium]|tara:strand:+ start:316 stop:2166 length:1851 start_codon:yes stop_codon:yes gene_type:complete
MKYKFVTKCTLITLFIVAQNSYSQDSYILNYEDVDIRKVTQDIAQFSKKTIILDPRVKGKVTIYSNANLDSNQIWDVYLRTIQVNGFSAISEDSFVRVVPENEATRDQTRDYSNGGGFETEVIPLINRSTEEILPMIKPITGRQSHLSSIPSVNSILIVDRASNIERIKELLSDLDKNNTAKISIIKLENLSSIEAVRILDRLKAQNNPTINKFIAIPFSPSNSVILSANDLITRNIMSTLDSLDKDIMSNDSMDVIYLKYAQASDIAGILNSISGSFISDIEGQKTVITHHEKTNALIISSAEENLNSIRNIIAKLDIRRAQVLVEAIVVDLSESAARRLGVEAIYSGNDEDSIPVGITRFSGSGADLLAIAGAADDEQDVTLTTTAISSLLNTQGLVAGFGDLTKGDDNFVGILNAIADDTDSNILSTPSILAMDNEPARLFIGQEIPITTGESLGTNNSNPFRTTSRQEVGIELEITPQINEGASVILTIKQGVSGIAGVAQSGLDIITNKREIETTVLVDNNQIIVLGGLIDEDVQEVVSKVPILGSIPLLGRIFQSSSTSTSTKNLMVFLKPTILTDSDSANEISLEKYNYFKAEQELKDNIIIDLTNPKD